MAERFVKKVALCLSKNASLLKAFVNKLGTQYKQPKRLLVTEVCSPFDSRRKWTLPLAAAAAENVPPPPLVAAGFAFFLLHSTEYTD